MVCEPEFTSKVREATVALLLSSAAAPIDDAAAAVFMSRRTLQRRMNAWWAESQRTPLGTDPRDVISLENLDVYAVEPLAGKTGYARIVKHAGRTLRRETVLTNPAEPGGPPPSATITVAIGAAEHPIPLDLEAPAPALLARICVADSLGGDQYLTTDTEVDYAPAALASLTRLATGLKAVGMELAERLAAAQPKPLDLRPFGEGTGVSRVLGSLSAATTDDSITALATLDAEELERMTDLRRKRGEIDAMQAPTLRKAAERSATNAEQLMADLRLIETALGAVAVKDARTRRDALLSARQAADLAATTFSAEPLPGVGSETWWRLWQAARAFAEHHDQQMPPTHEPASCPLCMQDLAPDARARLTRFDGFVKAEINVQVEKCRAGDRPRT